jgi:hypothetical protein
MEIPNVGQTPESIAQSLSRLSYIISSTSDIRWFLYLSLIL